MTSMTEIETAASSFAAAMRDLQREMGDLDRNVAAQKRRHMPRIKELAAEAAARKQALRDLVNGAPTLFARPRTRIFEGVKVGWSKGKGRLEWADAAQVIRLIRRHLADAADSLVKVTETPVRAAISRLPAADLKRIGVTVVDTGDQPVVELVDSEVEKLVDALLAASDGGQHA